MQWNHARGHVIDSRVKTLPQSVPPVLPGLRLLNWSALPCVCACRAMLTMMCLLEGVWEISAGVKGHAPATASVNKNTTFAAKSSPASTLCAVAARNKYKKHRLTTATGHLLFITDCVTSALGRNTINAQGGKTSVLYALKTVWTVLGSKTEGRASLHTERTPQLGPHESCFRHSPFRPGFGLQAIMLDVDSCALNRPCLLTGPQAGQEDASKHHASSSRLSAGNVCHARDVGAGALLILLLTQGAHVPSLEPSHGPSSLPRMPSNTTTSSIANGQTSRSGYMRCTHSRSIVLLATLPCVLLVIARAVSPL